MEQRTPYVAPRSRSDNGRKKKKKKAIDRYGSLGHIAARLRPRVASGVNIAMNGSSVAQAFSSARNKAVKSATSTFKHRTPKSSNVNYRRARRALEPKWLARPFDPYARPTRFM